MMWKIDKFIKFNIFLVVKIRFWILCVVTVAIRHCWKNWIHEWKNYNRFIALHCGFVLLSLQQQNKTRFYFTHQNIYLLNWIIIYFDFYTLNKFWIPHWIIVSPFPVTHFLLAHFQCIWHTSKSRFNSIQSNYIIARSV